MGRLSALVAVAVAVAAATLGMQAAGAPVAHASTASGIQVVRDTLSFCIELAGGRREFQIRIRNHRGVRTAVTVSVERGRAMRFSLAPTSRIRVLRGPWNGRHHPGGCVAVVRWGDEGIAVTLPLAQE